MIILDTCSLIYDALTPKQLSIKAAKAIDMADKKKQLFCADISLWEIGMLIQKKRIDPGVGTYDFLQLLIQARQIQVLSISAEIAALATTDNQFKHFDPADRLIAATALHYSAPLITCDQKFKKIAALTIIW